VIAARARESHRQMAHPFGPLTTAQEALQLVLQREWTPELHPVFAVVCKSLMQVLYSTPVMASIVARTRARKDPVPCFSLLYLGFKYKLLSVEDMLRAVSAKPVRLILSDCEPMKTNVALFFAVASTARLIASGATVLSTNDEVRALLGRHWFSVDAFAPLMDCLGWRNMIGRAHANLELLLQPRPHAWLSGFVDISQVDVARLAYLFKTPAMSQNVMRAWQELARAKIGFVYDKEHADASPPGRFRIAAEDEQSAVRAGMIVYKARIVWTTLPEARPSVAEFARRNGYSLLFEHDRSVVGYDKLASLIVQESSLAVELRAEVARVAEDEGVDKLFAKVLLERPREEKLGEETIGWLDATRECRMEEKRWENELDSDAEEEDAEEEEEDPRYACVRHVGLATAVAAGMSYRLEYGIACTQTREELMMALRDANHDDGEARIDFIASHPLWRAEDMPTVLEKLMQAGQPYLCLRLLHRCGVVVDVTNLLPGKSWRGDPHVLLCSEWARADGYDKELRDDHLRALARLLVEGGEEEERRFAVVGATLEPPRLATWLCRDSDWYSTREGWRVEARRLDLPTARLDDIMLRFAASGPAKRRAAYLWSRTHVPPRPGPLQLLVGARYAERSVFFDGSEQEVVRGDWQAWFHSTVRNPCCVPIVIALRGPPQSVAKRDGPRSGVDLHRRKTDALFKLLPSHHALMAPARFEIVHDIDDACAAGSVAYRVALAHADHLVRLEMHGVVLSSEFVVEMSRMSSLTSLTVTEFATWDAGPEEAAVSRFVEYLPSSLVHLSLHTRWQADVLVTLATLASCDDLELASEKLPRLGSLARLTRLVSLDVGGFRLSAPWRELGALRLKARLCVFEEPLPASLLTKSLPDLVLECVIGTTPQATRRCLVCTRDEAEDLVVAMRCWDEDPRLRLRYLRCDACEEPATLVRDDPAESVFWMRGLAYEAAYAMHLLDCRPVGTPRVPTRVTLASSLP
jgi:hypothetical protein